MRGILAIVLACMLSFTTPLSAADLGLPVKAPPPPAVVPAEEFDYLPLVLGALVVAGIVVCVLECRGHHEAPPPPVSPGATLNVVH